MRRIAELYAIETTIRGQTAAARQSVRQSKSLPLVTAMKAWLDTQLTLIPPRSGLADAIRYALIRWSALCSFLDDGRIELDTNTVERVIRPVALGRKNHLFAGSDGGGARWATVCSLQAQRGRALRLPQGRVGTHVQRPSNEPPRRSAALELAAENSEVMSRV